MGRQSNQIDAYFYASQGVQLAKAKGCGEATKKDEKFIDTPFTRNIIITNSSNTNLKNNACEAVSTVDWEDATGKHKVEAKIIILK